MGDLLHRKKIEIKDLSGRWVAIDAFNTLYQFLSIIRQKDGTPLMDSQGRVTSHLSGLLYRTTNLIEVGVKVAFIFDGEPPTFKAETLAQRSEAREKAAVRLGRGKGRRPGWIQVCSGGLPHQLRDPGRRKKAYLGHGASRHSGPIRRRSAGGQHVRQGRGRTGGQPGL